MKPGYPAKWFRRPGCQRVLATLLTTLVLALQCLVSAHGLHELFHTDADSAEHECAITLFAHGQVAVAATELALSPPPPIARSVVAPPAVVLVALAAQLPPGRAPPLPLV